MLIAPTFPLLRRWLQIVACLGLLLGLAACASRPPAVQPAPPLPKLAPPQAQANPPFLRIETGMHMSSISRIGVDAQERYLVTASDDKTARVWDLSTGALLRILRPPVGEGDEGKLYAVALSPDGTTVAAGGFTAQKGSAKNIYLFDRASGKLTRRIGGLPTTVQHLAYSSDGRYLAAALSGKYGIRVYRSSDGQEVGKDTGYGDSSWWVEFDRQGRLLSSSDDGYLRLYDVGFRRIAQKQAPGGRHPWAARFSPGGEKIAVGFDDSIAVNVLSADTLDFLYAPDPQGATNGSLNTVAWSQDGQWLYAGGIYHDSKCNRTILAWPQEGRGRATRLPAASDIIMDIRALAQNRLVFGSGDPLWAVLDHSGHKIQGQSPVIVDHRGIQLRLSANGGNVAFQNAASCEQSPVQFDLVQRRLQAAEFASLQPPRTTAKGLEISDWFNKTTPRLNGQPLTLKPYEMSRSLAIATDGSAFLLGTDWYLRLFDRLGQPHWETPVPGAAWAVNISADGRWAVAAFADGTIRWYGVEDGQERLAFFPHKDGKRWVLWTPEGFFDASPGAEDLIGYHINQGPDREGQFVEIKQLYGLFYRPDLVARRFAGDEQPIREALAAIGDVRQVLADGLPPSVELLSAPEVTQTNPNYTLQFKVLDQGGGIGELEFRINGKPSNPIEGGRPISSGLPGQDTMQRQFSLAPGDNIVEAIAKNGKNQIDSRSIKTLVHVQQPQQQADLYVLALGISNYQDHALQLKYADADADAISQTLRQHGAGLFRSVQVKPLLNEKATLAGIEAAFEELKDKVQPQDVFVLYLAGHAKTVDGRYHFAPWELKYENGEALRQNSLNQDRLDTLLAKIQAQKSVIMLDTCESGSFKLVAARGLEQKTAIDQLMHATGSAVLAATSDETMAVEGYEKHGVFTYALLQGMDKADTNHNQTIEIDELASFVADLVPKLTKQKWGFEQYPMRDLKKMSFPLGMKP